MPGLLFLVQGFAVSAANLSGFGQGQAAAAQVEQASMPCHGQSESGTTDAGAKCPCCDDSCPGMTGCALGHLAGAPAGQTIESLAPDVPPATIVADLVSPTLQSFLRPPIAFHG